MRMVAFGELPSPSTQSAGPFILLVAGDKSGNSERRFYTELIRKADNRFDAHLERLAKERK